MPTLPSTSMSPDTIGNKLILDSKLALTKGTSYKGFVPVGLAIYLENPLTNPMAAAVWVGPPMFASLSFIRSGVSYKMVAFSKVTNVTATSDADFSNYSQSSFTPGYPDGTTGLGYTSPTDGQCLYTRWLLFDIYDKFIQYKAASAEDRALGALGGPEDLDIYLKFTLQPTGTSMTVLKYANIKVTALGISSFTWL